MKTFQKSSSFAKKSFGPRSRAPYGATKRGMGRDFDKPLEMHQASCNKCHKMCEVPFRPNGKKPVYCRDCFRAEEPARPEGRFDRGEREESSTDLKKQFSMLNTKLDRLAAAIEEQNRLLSAGK